MFRKSFLDEIFDDLESFDFDTISRFARTSFKPGKNSYTLKVEVPGLGPEDVNVELKGQEIFITYNNKTNSFALPKDVDKDRIAASVKNGLLDITLPKIAIKESSRKIEVK